MQAACFQGCGLGSPCRRENIVFIIYLIMHLFIHLYFCVIYTDNPCRRDYIKVLNDNVCILYMPQKRFIYKQCTLQKGKYTIATIFFFWPWEGFTTNIWSSVQNGQNIIESFFQKHFMLHFYGSSKKPNVNATL